MRMRWWYEAALIHSPVQCPQQWLPDRSLCRTRVAVVVAAPAAVTAAAQCDDNNSSVNLVVAFQGLLLLQKLPW